MSKQIPDIFDKNLELGAVTAQTASANGTAIDLGAGGSSSGVVMAVLDIIGEPDFTTGNETYALKIQGANVADFSDAVSLVQFEGIQTAASPKVAGKHKAYFETTKRYVRYASTLGGTIPSWSFELYVSAG